MWILSSKRRAILSVTDKTGLEELARALLDHDYELLASGGTAQKLRDAGIPVREVSEFTGQAEILGERCRRRRDRGGRPDRRSHPRTLAQNDNRHPRRLGLLPR